MSRYRQWMYERLAPDMYVSEEFKRGVKDFLRFAVNQPICMDGNKIRCPCNRIPCRNKKYLEPDMVEYHLLMDGFVSNYYCWSSHGETFVPEIYGRRGYGETDPSVADNDQPNVDEAGSSGYDGGINTFESWLDFNGANPNENENEEIIFGPGAYDDELNTDEVAPRTCDDMRTMVLDAIGSNFEHPTYEPELPNPDAQEFYDLMRACENPVYDGCIHSLLSVVARLMSIKSEYNLPESCYDKLAMLISELLPKENIMPDSFYETKKLVHSLGLPVEKIDACIGGCMIYWGEDVALTECKICSLPRYKCKKKRIAHSVMWYFPLAARLKRLYTSKATSSHMRWHAEHPKDPDIMTHPSDSEAWRDFDNKHPEFANETRNIRLGLCTDGFIPFGQYGKQYSSWPVIVTPYNLPPGMCMKEEFMFLTAIIPGPKNPKQKIDVFLQPLIAELIQLWHIGIQAFDSSRKQNFILHAALMWTISDFPAYSMLSGWPTSGKLACPHCMGDTDAFTLAKGGKQSWFDNHRKFLAPGHPFRRNTTKFTRDKVVSKEASPVQSGNEILEWIDELELMKATEYGYKEHNEWIHNQSNCGWKKRSIFWDLPYWSTNLIRHNLDVMHIEKNCFENVFSTVMDVKGKTKDNDKSREDLRNICNRPELDMDKAGKYQPAQYKLKKEAVDALCEWVKGLKFPDGYASNLSRCVEMKKYQMSGMKSHDCHVFMQRLVPIAFRELLPEPVWAALTEFSLFFKDLTCTTIRVEDMVRLEKEIPIILCKLEQIFPPSFFDSMEHLPVHLPYEARIAGPVHYRWMYPFERYLKHLKKTVGNRARVEGSIGNAYLTEEASNFGSHYFEPHVHTRRRKVGRNDDGGERKLIPGNLSIFTHPGRISGKCTKILLSDEEYRAARSYILLNCKEIEPYVSIFAKYLQDNSIADTDAEIADKIDKDFAEWFEYFAQDSAIIDHNEFISALAQGPLRRVKSCPVYFVNGYKFHTMKYGSDKVTSNSGVCIKGFTDLSDQLSSNDYYGILTDILELEYPRLPIKRTVMFKCQWFDPSSKGTYVHKRYNLVDINIQSRYPKYDPFCLAMQAVQVCYVPYPRIKTVRSTSNRGRTNNNSRMRNKDWWAVFKVKARPAVVQLTNTETEKSAFQDDEAIGHRITSTHIELGALNDPEPEPDWRIHAAEEQREIHHYSSESTDVELVDSDEDSDQSGDDMG